MRVVIGIGRDVGVVHRAAGREIGGHLGEGNAVGVLACAGAHIGKVDERIMAAVVEIAGAAVKSLETC